MEIKRKSIALSSKMVSKLTLTWCCYSPPMRWEQLNSWRTVSWIILNLMSISAF